MTRGTPPPDLAGVRSATPPLPVRDPDARRGLDASRLLVMALMSLFVFGALGLGLGILNPPPKRSASPSPTGAVAPAAQGGVPEVALASIVPAVVLPSPVGWTADPNASPDPNASLDPGASLDPAASVDPFASPFPSGSPDASLDPFASPSPDPSPTDPGVAGEVRMPFVPVVSFWSTDTSIGRAELITALKGQKGPYSKIIVPAGDRGAIADALGIHIADSVVNGDVAAITKAVRAGALGVMRASDVPFSVRALGINDRELFGNDRVKTLTDWPLVGNVQATPGQAWDQKSTWTLVAGGDSFTDRGVYERVVNRHKGIHYPFDGGTVKVTGHYCCGPVVGGNKVPRYVFTDNKGIVRSLVKDADLAIANHESPITDNWRFHLAGTIFSGKPSLTEIFTRAGIDWFSLANNHIKDYGTTGVLDTRKWLDHYGIKYGGAGKNLDQSRKVSYLETHGTRIGIVACVMVGKAAWATPSSGGGMPCKNKYVLPLIDQAKANADFVIVFPHWGVEYSRAPLDKQRKLAAAWVAEGADLILGAHSHVAGAIEQIGDAPVFYSMGNFIFDQNWSTYTMEAVLLEMTFEGDRLVQIRIRPTLSHDQAQIHLLNPATDDGRAILKAVRRASSEWLRW